MQVSGEHFAVGDTFVHRPPTLSLVQQHAPANVTYGFYPERIVIIGGGFSGIACAKMPARTQAPISVIDRDNYRKIRRFRHVALLIAFLAQAAGRGKEQR